MKHSIAIGLVVGLFTLLLAISGAAHHSFVAEFDDTKPVTLTGTVTRVDWRNPHAFLYLDVVDGETDEITNWAVELGSPNGLRRLGWRQTTVSVGDVLTIEGVLARVKPNLANAQSAVLASTGERLGASSSRTQ